MLALLEGSLRGPWSALVRRQVLARREAEELAALRLGLGLMGLLCCPTDALLTFHQLLPGECLQKYLLVCPLAKDLQTHQGVASLRPATEIFVGTQDPLLPRCQTGQRILEGTLRVRFSQSFSFELFYASRLCSILL